MKNIKVIFTLDEIDISMQCSKDDKMRDICQKFAIKVETNLNSLVFLYEGNQVNLDLILEAQASSIDKKNNEMKILVYRKNNKDELVCPNCGEKINLNTEKINDLISSNNNFIDTMNGIQDLLENIIRNSNVNNIHNQLKNIKILINTINEDIKKNNEKLHNLSHDIINNGGLQNKVLTKKINKDNINNFNEKIKYLENDINKKDNIIKELKIINEQKLKEINALKSCVPFDIKAGDKLMSVIFNDTTGHISHYSILCKNTQVFSELEKILYDQFPNYKQSENAFIFNGNVINKFKTLKENKIKHGDYIIVYPIDE